MYAGFRVAGWVLAIVHAGYLDAPWSWRITLGAILGMVQTGLIVAWTLRTRRVPGPALAIADLAVIALMAHVAAEGDFADHRFGSWVYLSSFVMIPTLGMVLPRLWQLLVALLLWDVNWFAAAVGSGEPFMIADYLLWGVNSLGVWFAMRSLLSFAAQAAVSREREEANLAAAARADQRLEFVRLLHDHPLQTMELLARGTDVADPEMRRRLLADATRLRAYVRHGTTGTAGSLQAVLIDCASDAGRDGLRVRLELSGLDRETPAPAGAEAAVRAALDNVARHSGTDAATLSATDEGGTVSVSITDKGRGFDTDQKPVTLPARFHVLSEPGEGTSVTLLFEVCR
ncbi:hypothetical protein GCM10009550_20790 [Actinocorallia libanotica]|uniref:Signal transduction histidine kinase n=2 Tax=Actinocorallia libanotica TaxID=46162 RepID=A0ABN1QRV2_9ACTN